jgi:nitroimidazol reductase NimA-like FMN-containing flavoprotein (pyridoxamine 5'-phosphate oxidase superfamily)
MIPPLAVRTGGAGLVELSRADCLRLLATGAVGRVVFTDRALPAAHPVTYLLDQEEIVFRTASGAKIAVASVRNIVAFQVDQIDLDNSRGWSVLGIGQAYEIIDPERLVTLTPRMPRPWASGAANGHVIGIPLQQLSGRQLLP